MAKRESLSGLTRKPQHIAIIMDGNGRWAEARHLPRMAGHRAGTENLRRVIRACVEFGIPYLTIYAFSTENWKRPSDEVEGLMGILGDVLEREISELNKEGVQLRHIGRLEQLGESLRNKILNAIELTKNNERLILSIAWNYGGRDEITHAIQKMLKKGTKPEEVNDELIGQFLYTHGTPDPDLMIRTSGELRTSNFLIWQSAYAEWYFTEILWPDFDKEALHEAIVAFGQRERRFGGRNSKQEQEQYAG